MVRRLFDSYRSRARSAVSPALETLSRYADRGFTVLLLAMVGIQVLLAPTYSKNGRLFALVIGPSTLLLLAVILVVQSSGRVRAAVQEFGTKNMFTTGEQIEAEVDSADASKDVTATRINVLAITAWITLLLVGIYVVGFLWTILLFSVAFYRVQAELSWRYTLLYTLAIWGVIVVIFVEALNLRFYRGILALPHPLPF